MKIEDGKLYVKYTNSENYLEIGEIQGKSGLEFIQKLLDGTLPIEIFNNYIN